MWPRLWNVVSWKAGRLGKPAHVREQGQAGIKALAGRPGRTKGRPATCISTDSVMLCRRLGAAGLYGKPQERKGPGKRVRAGAGEGARLRWPEGALPAAPAGGWARPGRGRPWRKLLFPFPRLLPPLRPALLEGLCGRDPEAHDY